MWTFNSIVAKIFEVLFLPFRSLSPWWGMLVVSLLTGLGMLLIFKYTSNQAGIRRTKDRIKAHLLEMRLYQDSLRNSFKAQGGILKANLKYMSHSLKPLLVMFVPVILILIQLNFWFAYRPLKPGEPVLLKLKLKESFSPMETEIELQPALTDIKVPLANGGTLTLKDGEHVCDACGETFEGARQLPPIECPKCHEKAGVYLRWMECRKCGKRFEGLRHRPVPGREDEFLPKDLTDMPQLQVKLRDSEWVGPGSEEGIAIMRASFVCPFCKTRDARVVGPPAMEANRRKK